MKLVLWLLSMALSHHGAGGFLVHLATECPLAANGSVLWFSFTFVFNKNPLVCYNDHDRLFEACDMGLLHNIAVGMATQLNADPDWRRRMAGGAPGPARARASGSGAARGKGRRPPSVRIVSTAPAEPPRGTTRLTCHVWGFYPAEVLVTWLRNGSPVEPTENGLSPALANGDWTYQTHLSLLTAPQARGHLHLPRAARQPARAPPGAVGRARPLPGADGQGQRGCRGVLILGLILLGHRHGLLVEGRPPRVILPSPGTTMLEHLTPLGTETPGSSPPAPVEDPDSSCLSPPSLATPPHGVSIHGTETEHVSVPAGHRSEDGSDQIPRGACTAQHLLHPSPTVAVYTGAYRWL
ncbi:unnamed protein product [Eretmochelys imbricata]